MTTTASAPAELPFRLLVFDWDGTVVDSIGAIVDCTFAALAALGDEAPPPPPRDDVRHAIGLGLIETLTRFWPEAGPELRERVLEAYREQWWGTYKDRFHPFPGARETLATLGGAGYLLGVATAKSRRGLAREFERSGFEPLFQASRTVDEAPSKPHPGMLTGIFDELGVDPSEALMIGDTTWDLEMARNAGCPSVAVLSGAQPESLLELERPLACLPDLNALPQFLSGVPARRLAG
ncbi:MAG: HAD-IA family hydrolase [Thermoanaerobaculia bacterium]|nr:HAD-IA family hydrolase [Thermoanaerobaculia bacterium]